MTTATIHQFIETEQSELATVITDYAASEQFDKDCWRNAVMIAYNAGCTTKEEWQKYYEAAEEEQAANRQFNGEVIKRTKAGKVVASKAFTKTWNTDKAIIGKALDAGLDLLDSAGEVVPKTKMQEQYKESAPKSEKTAFEKITTTINTFQSLYGELTAEEQDNVRTQMSIIMGIV